MDQSHHLHHRKEWIKRLIKEICWSYTMITFHNISCCCCCCCCYWTEDIPFIIISVMIMMIFLPSILIFFWVWSFFLPSQEGLGFYRMPSNFWNSCALGIKLGNRNFTRHKTQQLGIKFGNRHFTRHFLKRKTKHKHTTNTHIDYTMFWN